MGKITSAGALPTPTPCTRGAVGPRRRRASARPSKCSRSASPHNPLLYSLWGFRYCDLLLVPAERAAWQIVLGSARVPRAAVGVAPTASKTLPSPPTQMQLDEASRRDASLSTPEACAPLLESCRTVSQRAARTLKWAEMGGQGSLLEAFHSLVNRYERRHLYYLSRFIQDAERAADTL